MPLYLVLYIAVTFRHSCLPVIAWQKVVLHFFDPKQLLEVSSILWCYLSKWYSTILQSASLWCCIFVLHYPDVISIWEYDAANHAIDHFIPLHYLQFNFSFPIWMLDHLSSQSMLNQCQTNTHLCSLWVKILQNLEAIGSGKTHTLTHKYFPFQKNKHK